MAAGPAAVDVEEGPGGAVASALLVDLRREFVHSVGDQEFPSWGQGDVFAGVFLEQFRGQFGKPVGAGFVVQEVGQFLCRGIRGIGGYLEGRFAADYDHRRPPLLSGRVGVANGTITKGAGSLLRIPLRGLGDFEAAGCGYATADGLAGGYGYAAADGAAGGYG